jgi:DNA transformation protein and related proteins
VSLEDPETLKELFAAYGPVSVRRMFGGAGIFRDGLMIALVADGELFLKADSETVPAFEAERMKPFTYGKGKQRVVMSYWRMPDRLLDDPDELAEWARAALGAAKRAAVKASRKSSVKKKKR